MNHPFKSILLAVGIVVATLLSLSTPITAKIYRIPPELKLEVNATQQIASANPSAQSYFEYAMACAYTGQIERGWKILAQIPSYDKNYAPKVIAKYDPAIRENPSDWKAHFKLAFGYYFLDQKQKSIDSFKQVLAIDPKNVWAMGFIGLVEGDLKHYAETISWAKKALAIEPNATAIHFLLGEAYLKTGNYLGLAGEIISVGRLKSEEARASQ